MSTATASSPQRRATVVLWLSFALAACNQQPQPPVGPPDAATAELSGEGADVVDGQSLDALNGLADLEVAPDATPTKADAKSDAKADAKADTVAETVAPIVLDCAGDNAATPVWAGQVKDVTWTKLEALDNAADVTACLPLTELPAEIVPPTQCWKKPMPVVAATKPFDAKRLHVFANGDLLLIATGPCDGVARPWWVKDNGKTFVPVPTTGTDALPVAVEQWWLASAPNRSAATVAIGQQFAQITWLDAQGSVTDQVVLPLPVTQIDSVGVDDDGFLYVTSYKKATVLGVSKSASLTWLLQLKNAGQIATMVPGKGALLFGGSHDLILLSKTGAITARAMLPAGTQAAILDGKGGLFAQTALQNEELFGQSYFTAMSMVRLDKCGAVIWSETEPMGMEVHVVLAAFGAGPSKWNGSLDDARWLHSTPQGVAVLRDWSPGYIARWSHEGERRTALPLVQFDLLGTAVSPDGGFAIASETKLARTNAAGSVNCTGCGGDAPACDDEDACTADLCSPVLAGCSHTPIPGCKKFPGNCLADADCDDSDPCTNDTCQAPAGLCKHGAATECVLGNRCLDTTNLGTCVQGKCTPPPFEEKKIGTVQGWVAGLDTARPQLLEAKGGDLLIAGGWYAARYQGNGVLRWRRQLSGQIAAIALTPDDGLLMVMRQTEPVAPGKTRLVRLSATGKVLSETLVTTGLEDWHLREPWNERKRWLLPRAGGGFSFVGTQAWTADAWQGRVVELSAAGAVTGAVDVSLTGLAGNVPAGRSIDQVWPGPDGGLYLGWHRVVSGEDRAWGGARISASGKVVWSQALTAAPMRLGGFDPWRPRGLWVAATEDLGVSKVALLPNGPGPQVLGDATHFGNGIFGSNPELRDVLAYAELPGERTAAAAYLLEPNQAAFKQYFASGGPFGGKGSWPKYDQAFFDQWKTPFYVKLPPYDAPDVVRAWLQLEGHAIADIYVLSNKRVALLASHPPRYHVYPALIVLDDQARFKPCGVHWYKEKCDLWPGAPCKY